MKLRYALLIALSVASPLSVFANPGWDCGPGNLESNTCVVGTIGRIEQYADGGFVFNLAIITGGATPFCAAISTWSQSNAFVRAGSVTGVHGSTTVTADGVKAFLASLLAAKLSAGKVQVYTLYTSATDQCVVGAIDVQ